MYVDDFLFDRQDLILTHLIVTKYLLTYNLTVLVTGTTKPDNLGSENSDINGSFVV